MCVWHDGFVLLEAASASGRSLAGFSPRRRTSANQLDRVNEGRRVCVYIYERDRERGGEKARGFFDFGVSEQLRF